MPLFYLVVIAFLVWMLFDAIQRRAEFYWFLIILLFVPPLGALIYFFAVKLRDYDLGRLVAARATHPAIAELRHRAAESPTVENSLALADALEQRSRYTEAAEYYSGVLEQNREEKQALLGLARCKLGMNRPEEAVDLFGRLIELDRGYADYGAALEYADALWQNGQEDDALELLEALSGVTRRLNHRLAFAHYLSQAEQTARAIDVIEGALAEHQEAPPHLRQRYSGWARRARHMLGRLRRSRH